MLPIFGGDTGSELIDIFTKYTSSDIERPPAEVIGILKSFIAVRDVPVKRGPLRGQPRRRRRDGVAYVTATQEQIDKAVEEFLGERGPEGPRAGDEATRTRSRRRREEEGEGGGDPTRTRADLDRGRSTAIGAGPTSSPRFGRTSARRLKFPVCVPTAVVPGSAYDDGSRQYEIKDVDDEKQPPTRW